MPAQEKLMQQPGNTLLNAEEQRSPQLFFENLLSCYHLNEITNYLQEIKHWVINRNYNYSEDSIAHDNLVYFFEKMQALIEAVYNMEERRQEAERIKEDQNEEAASLFGMLMDKVDALYNAANYLHQKNQNELCCYLLHKTAIGAYHALVLTVIGTTEETSNLEELANVCSRVFKIPNPFNSQNVETRSLSLLNSVTLSPVFRREFIIDDDVTEYLMKTVHIIRRDICSFYESKGDKLKKKN